MSDILHRAGCAGVNVLSVRAVAWLRTRAAAIACVMLAATPLATVPSTEAEASRLRTGNAAAPRASTHDASRATPQAATRAPASSSANAASSLPSSQIVVAVRRAETATGIDAALLLAMAGRESNFDPNARSRNSSAQGLMQFTNDTWLEAVRDFGHMHGLQRQATELSSVPRGSLPANARLIDDTLRLRSDARLSTVMAAERLASWRAQLERDIGRRMSPVDLYFVHLLGPTGGRRFLLELARTPRRAAAEIVPDAARVNRKIFAPHGRPLSLAEVHRQVTQSLVLTPAVAVALQATAPVQIADAR